MIGVKRSDSLAIRAVFWSLIAVIFVSIGFSATQVYLEFQDELEADRLALAQAVSASRPALVNAAYQLDSVLAQQLIKGLLMNEIVDAARLEDDSGAVLASGSNPALDETMPLVSLLIEKRKTVAAIPLFKDALDTSADSAEFYAERNLTPVFGRDSKACLRMVAGGRADLFVHPAPIFKVLVNWLNLEDVLMQRDEIAGEMPFYLLMSTRNRPQVSAESEQLGAALLRLQRAGQWQKMLQESEQRAIARCLKDGQTTC